MKRFIKQDFFLWLIAMMLITSCVRDVQPPTFVPRPYTNPWAGKEIQLDSLRWELNDEVDNVNLYIFNRPELFVSQTSLEVFLRQDTAWVRVVPSPGNGFVYYLVFGGVTISPYPADTSLKGKIASVRLKF